MSRKTKNDTLWLTANNLLKNKKKRGNYRYSNIKMKGPEVWIAKQNESIVIVDFIKIMTLTVSLIVSRQKSRQSNRQTATMFPK